MPDTTIHAEVIRDAARKLRFIGYDATADMLGHAAHHLDALTRDLEAERQAFSSLHTEALRMNDKIAAQSERIKALEDALKDVMSWISNWDPNFIQDHEWPDTKARVSAALAPKEVQG